MTRRLLLMLLLLASATMQSMAQKVDPKAYYTNKDGAQEGTSIDDGQAPLPVTFRANPTDLGTWTPSYEWHFIRVSKAEGNQELFVRYEEDTDYTFMDSGTFNVVLKTKLKDDNGNEDALEDATIVVSIAESKLEFPNAFSPNGDGHNDIYRAKPDYKSIISFRAIILNRWGQKLYEWKDLDGGWDGKFHGKDVAQGVYYVLVEAKGGDGKEYNIRKDVNLLRGYTENGNTTGGN